MSLPKQCGKCKRAEWAGNQEVRCPTRLDAIVWHRRTHCKFCGWAQEELRSPGLIQLTSRDQPIDWTGGNPFISADEYEP